MQLYEIVLPVEDNSGNSYEGSHIAFRSWLLEEFGGYTQQPNSAGGWKDHHSGRCHFDIVTPYRVACESTNWNNVIHKASELFSDQHALMWSNIGTAVIWERTPIAA